jgi:hypothetical protein
MLHTVVRMASLILDNFERLGPLLARTSPPDWPGMWEVAAGRYELLHNHDIWIAVYHNGKPLFTKGSRHSLLDIIEQVDARNGKTYEDNLKFAEALFSQAGRPVTIFHDSGVAGTFNLSKTQAKIGVILRGGQRTTNFFITGDGDRVTASEYIIATANFLEGIQLSFVIGQGNERQRRGRTAMAEYDPIALAVARGRMDEIMTAIDTFEKLNDVFYRPERPNFSALITSAELVTRKRLESVEG